MRRRVLMAIMAVTATVVMLFAVPLGFVLERLLDDRAVLALEHRAEVAARNIDLTDATDVADASEFPDGPERFAIYDAAGRRIVGIGPLELPRRVTTVNTASTGQQRSTVEEGSNLVTTLPVMSGESVLGYLRVQRSLAAVDATTRRARALLVGGAAAALGVGWIIALRLARKITTSTESLRDAAIRLGSGDFTITATPTGIAELDDVGEALNITARQLGELVDREQAFSADVSHQLRTPIAGLRAALETELAFPRDDRTVIVRESLGDVERFEQTVADVLSFARSEQLAKASIVDVTEVVRRVHRNWVEHFVRSRRVLALSVGIDPCFAVGNAALLGQAIGALVDNALKHGDGRTSVVVSADDSTVTVSVTDAGVARLQPGESVRSDTPTGMGLALTHRLVRAQGGRVVDSLHESEPSVRIVLLRPEGAAGAKSGKRADVP